MANAAGETEAERRLRARLDSANAEIKKLVRVLERAYLAHHKPEWAEGECWNEVDLDVVFAVEDHEGPGTLRRKARRQRGD